MKAINLKLAALSVVASIGLFAFSKIETGSIKGKVTPANGAAKVWAISGTDTLKASVDGGTFNIMDAKPGTYKLIVEAMPPYKNMAKEGVTVSDGQSTDVGEIKLQQGAK
ncbi:MAG TPA: carboxypeptidase-like regulatory domain-containing protein [Puia sp.]|nr:carboxypeptidase-like regulatory domain-containing protein [Puia sp.]